MKQIKMKNIKEMVIDGVEDLVRALIGIRGELEPTDKRVVEISKILDLTYDYKDKLNKM